MIYLRVQTNRVKLKEVLASFQHGAIDGERLIAPRPLPKTYFKYYVGYACVIDGSVNEKILTAIKNHKKIEKSVFESEVKSIDYFWESAYKDV